MGKNNSDNNVDVAAALEQDGVQSLPWITYLLRAEFMNQLYVSGRCTLALFFLSLLIGSRFVGYFSIGM